MFMFPVILQQTDDKSWVLFCEMLGCSLDITQATELCEVAGLYGWVACECGLTDGTTACNHKTPATMLKEAQGVLVANVGWEAHLMSSSYLSNRLFDVFAGFA